MFFSLLKILLPTAPKSVTKSCNLQKHFKPLLWVLTHITWRNGELTLFLYNFQGSRKKPKLGQARNQCGVQHCVCLIRYECAGLSPCDDRCWPTVSIWHCTKSQATILSYRLFTPDNCLPPHSSSRPPPPTTPRVHVLFCHTQMPIIMSDYIKSKQFLLPHMRHRKMAFKLLSVRSLAVFICGLLLPSFAFSLFILVCCFFHIH